MSSEMGCNQRVERPWGWYEVVTEGANDKVKRIGVYPGKRLSLQRHQHRAEHWLVVRGTAHVTLGDGELELTVGQHCDIAAKQVHRLANLSNDMLEIIEIQLGFQLEEDDIVRLHDDYGRPIIPN